MGTRTPTESLWNGRTWAVSADRSRQSGSITLRVSSTVGRIRGVLARRAVPAGFKIARRVSPTLAAQRLTLDAVEVLLRVLVRAPAGHHWKPPAATRGTRRALETTVATISSATV